MIEWFPTFLAISLALILILLLRRLNTSMNAACCETDRDLNASEGRLNAFTVSDKPTDDISINAADLDEPFRRAAENVRKHPPKEAPHPRPIGKHPALAAPYGIVPKKQFSFNARQLQRVNIQRRMRGAPPLNRAGFQNAIAHAWDQPRRQPDTSDDWLVYLIMYQCLTADHASHSATVNYGIDVNPNEPYNGHGGEFAGAGASGDWRNADPGIAAAAAGIAGSAALSDGPYVGEGPGAAVSPSDPTPSYSAPSDPTPSSSPPSSYDSGSSSSYDSGPSSSIDSGSSGSYDSGSSGSY